MEKEKNSKQYQSLTRTIHHLLKDFQKNRQWADIGNWLHRFHQALLQKKFSQLPHQITIAKRLAQCLNPNLPAGVHSHALKVYTLILTNFSSVKNILPLMSIGLFPFFQYSSSQLKTELIKIFEQHFLNNSQSLQMIISLLNALLTGLNQSNEELSKKIYNLCDSISNKYGKIWVDGAIWVNILKSQKVRIPGFKYLMKVFKDRDKQKLSESVEVNLQTCQKQEKPDTKQNQTEKIQQIQQEKELLPSKQQQKKQEIVSIVNNNIPQKILLNLREEQKFFLNKLFEQKNVVDGPHNRFPNFSLLVVNALCSCLGNQSESLVKRAALDLVVTHLKISYKNILQRADAIILVQSMLRTIKLKQYSLTRRIYTYLFDQPNSQGQYIINEGTRQYEIQILIEALKNLLNQKSSQTQKSKVIAQAEQILLILETLMADHPKLKEILIPKLAYNILSFMKLKAFSTSLIYKALRKKIFEFNDNILLPNKKMFIRSILKIISIASKPEQQLIEGIQLLDFCLHTLLKIRYESNKGSSSNRKNSSQLSHKSQQDKSSEMGEQMKELYIGIIDQTLLYLKQSKFQYEKLSIEILQLSNKLLKQLKQSHCQLSKSIISNIDDLIEMKPSKIIFARLLTLHPYPKKQILLPHLNEGAFSIVCITNLLFDNESIQLTQDEQVEVFQAIFKLLNCHLWEDKAIQFILQFQIKYQETFKSQIEKVQPSEWLIYWRKRNGDVTGGVIRMIKNVKNSNPLTKHLSCKWIEESNDIISKIIDPIFKLIKDLKQVTQKDQITNEIHMNQQGIIQTYQLIEIIFDTAKQSFARFFFLQKNKYLSPFLQFVFKNLEHKIQAIRSKSIQMMKFVLGHTVTYEEKYDFINSTIEVSLYSLNQIIIKKNIMFEMQEPQMVEKIESQNINAEIQRDESKQTFWYLQQIQLLQYLITININLRKAFKDSTFKRTGLIQIFQSKGLFNVIVKGMSESQLPYIRTLYLDYLRDFCDLLSKIQNSATILKSLINMILEKLFFMLKKHDVTNLQQIIQGRQQNNTKATVIRTRRLSFDDAEQEDASNSIFNKNTASIYRQTYQISKNDLNLQSKYAQIIQMWNSIKFFISFSMNQSIQQLPIVNLLSLILQSFPFSYLKYTQIHLENDNKQAVNNYEQLQDQIKNVTGLKKQVLQIFDLIWDKFNRQIIDFLIQRGDPRILIHCSTDPIKAVETIGKSQKIKQIIKYFKNAKLNLPKNILHYNGETLTKQNYICHFLYLYLMYCNFFLIKNKKLGGFLQSLLHIMRAIKNSQHIQTKLWIFEMIHLLSERILLNKEVYIEGGQKIKQQLQQITKDIVDDLVSAIVKSKNFTHKSQLKTGLLSIFSKQEKENSLYDFVKMYPPTIFGLFEPYKRKSKKLNKKQQNVAEIIAVEQYVQQFLFSQWLNRTQSDFMQYLSICSIKTLISIGNNLIINIYQKDTSKIALIIKQIVVCLLPVCQDKSDQNMINVELISQYIFKVLDSNSLRSELLKFIRKNLLQIYMANEFFKCTKKSLYYWKGIIDYCTQGYDLLSELMSKEGLFDGFLKGKTQVLRLKIKSFERICFVIYAGKIDKYQNKLRTVLQSLNDVMKQQNPQPALLILMLFCIRILLMRLSQSSLNKMFRSVWPGLITTLIQIFGKQKNSRNINLFLAALKVVELIHALQLQEFHLHKWMFIIDFFGIRIQPNSSNQYEIQLKQSDILTPFVFKPYLTKLLPLHLFRCCFKPQFYQYQKQGQRRQQIKRKIIIKQSNIQTLQQVQNLCYVLIQYMIDLNQKKVYVNKTQIEDVIQGDFICLDDYIFQVK